MLGAACGADAVGPPPGGDTTLVIVPRTVLLTPGDSIRLRGVVSTATGDTLDSPVGFVARDPAVASVTAQGLVRGEGLGTTWIVADALGRLDSVFATVAANVALPGLRLLTDQLSEPVFLTQPPGESDRLFVVEQGGRIRILRNDVLLARPFLDLTAVVSPPPLGERGLLSMAFDPGYQQNGFFYASYTDRQGDSRVVRYRVSSANPDSADPASASPVLAVEQPYSNHNGGLILFGPDGMLYLGLGDGGAGGDPEDRAQNLDSLLGKLLRLDVSGATGYTVPPDNPFVGNPDARPEIWASGLRNPWRFSFDRATGDLYIADVGQGDREEVNAVPGSSPGGENYGWNIMEGRACYPPGRNCSTAGLTLPVLDYDHSAGACAVTGGYVYRGAALPILAGRYLYADYCGGWVRSFTLVAGQAVDLVDWTAELGPGPGVTSFGQDNAGELYLMAGGRALYRIVPDTGTRITQ
jgi:glucose/arabinose dehydrogenase